MVAGGQLYFPGDGTYFEAACLAELIRILWGIFKSLALPGIDTRFLEVSARSRHYTDYVNLLFAYIS
jgi:hypothetical protein